MSNTALYDYSYELWFFYIGSVFKFMTSGGSMLLLIAAVLPQWKLQNICAPFLFNPISKKQWRSLVWS